MKKLFIKREKTVYRVCGDHYLMLQFGNEVDISLNFKAIITREVILEEIKEVCEIVVGTSSLLINYDPIKIKVNDLIEKLKKLEKQKINFDKEIPSRLISVPILFNDKWTRECSKAHSLPPDLEFVAEYNGMGIEEFISVFTNTDYWVKYVGFSPGLIAFNALDPGKELIAPQLKVPRTWTPRGAVGIGYSGSTIYSGRTPGGIRMIGRTPLLTWDVNETNLVFKNGYALFKAGDRIRFISITEKEYFRIEENIHNYSYVIQEGIYKMSWLKRN